MEDYAYISQLIKQCIIAELGCSDYKMDEENNFISFTYQDISYVCFYDAKEPFYLRIMIPNIDTFDINIDNSRTFLQILKMNTQFKTGKFIIVENVLWIAAEVMLTGTTRITKTFYALVNLLLHMRSEYATYINNISKEENKNDHE